MGRPNGLPFSRRRGVQHKAASTSHNLARRRRSDCMRVLAALGASVVHPSVMRAKV